MTLEEYQYVAHETAIYPPEQGRIYTVLGLLGEAGELANKVKKIIRGDLLTHHPAMEELGDVLWYVAECATAYGYTLEQIASDNLTKLADRQSRGVIGGSGDNR